MRSELFAAWNYVEAPCLDLQRVVAGALAVVAGLLKTVVVDGDDIVLAAGEDVVVAVMHFRFVGG